jgi:hypothetical protein
VQLVPLVKEDLMDRLVQQVSKVSLVRPAELVQQVRLDLPEGQEELEQQVNVDEMVLLDSLDGLGPPVEREELEQPAGLDQLVEQVLLVQLV